MSHEMNVRLFVESRDETPKFMAQKAVFDE